MPPIYVAGAAHCLLRIYTGQSHRTVGWDCPETGSGSGSGDAWLEGYLEPPISAFGIS
jgi:hypothetical protein